MLEGREGAPTPKETEGGEKRMEVLNRIHDKKRTFQESPGKIKKLQEGFSNIPREDEDKRNKLIEQISELVTPYEISVYYMQTLNELGISFPIPEKIDLDKEEISKKLKEAQSNLENIIKKMDELSKNLDKNDEILKGLDPESETDRKKYDDLAHENMNWSLQNLYLEKDWFEASGKASAYADIYDLITL